MKFYMRLPVTKSISLTDLVHASSNQNFSEVLERLISLGDARESMKALLDDQDKISSSREVLVTINSIKKYLSELQDLEKYVLEDPSLKFTFNVVFIWKSAILESSLGGMSRFYSKRLLTSNKSEFRVDAKAESQSKSTANPSLIRARQKSHSKILKDSRANSAIDSESVNRKSITEIPLAARSNLLNPESENSILVDPFNQKQTQDPQFTFEKANTLYTLGIAKLLYAYTLFDSFALCFDSELSNYMLPQESNLPKKEKLFSSARIKNKATIKNVFSLKKSASKQQISATISDAENEITDQERAQKMTQAVKELRESSGIFHYILSELVPRLTLDLTNSDLNPTILSMLEKVSLADADRFVANNAIRLSYKSSIISRMLLYVSEQYRLVLSLSKSLKLDSTLSVNSNFLTFIKKNNDFVYSLSLVFLAKDSFEKNSYGLSVSYIREAKHILIDLVKDKQILKYVPNVQSILNQTEQLYSMYTRNNDTFGFERVPSKSELESKIPSGRPFNEISSFNPTSGLTQYF
ncbi:hypothetical protein BB560_001927 [Smittium megazygosporum]|uniref:pH-response regulator protein palC n=1 Tax=Smittium megazygosporum TaxID=133381 RepID=A0A2T9ZD33_9FUNG|nr:hypothetical protein BB560_003060 [Smittium megazygosporum]PVV03588.1 hypothetical protein BB560_001927 [Smittium megazygosporum]